jgi:hypothetical protein
MADHEKLPFHELSAINQQTLATAYWAMDYYFGCGSSVSGKS